MSDRAYSLRLLPDPSPLGGSAWLYRSAEIQSNKAGTMFNLVGKPPGLPGRWQGFGNKEHLMALVDGWLDHQKLPAGYQVPER